MMARALTGDSSRRWRLLALAAFLLPLAGCIRETVNGSESVYTTELWAPLLIGLVGILALPAGFALRTKSARFGWILMILSPILTFGVAPSMYMDCTTVSDKTFDVRTGIYGGTKYSVDLGNVSAVRVTSETKRTRRGRSTTHYFNFDMKTGNSVKVPVDNSCVKASLPKLVNELQAREIPFIDQFGSPD